jgi:hypothetical protein
MRRRMSSAQLKKTSTGAAAGTPVPSSRRPKVEWEAGRCCYPQCPMTLVMYVGAERQLCWLHAIVYGIV